MKINYYFDHEPECRIVLGFNTFWGTYGSMGLFRRRHSNKFLYLELFIFRKALIFSLEWNHKFIETEEQFKARQEKMGYHEKTKDPKNS